MQKLPDLIRSCELEIKVRFKRNVNVERKADRIYDFTFKKDSLFLFILLFKPLYNTIIKCNHETQIKFWTFFDES
jgi:hypothetical protein